MTFHAALNVGRALGMSDLLVNEPKPTPGHEAVLQELKDTRARALESYITSKINAETKLVMDSYVENMAQLMWAPLGNLVPNKLVPNAGGEYKYKYTNIWMQDSVGPRYKPVEFKTCAGSVNVIRETMTAVGVQPDKLAQISAVSAVLNRTVNDGPPLGPQLYDGLTAEQCLERYESRQREDACSFSGVGIRLSMTPLQLTAARNLWSKRLRAKVKESTRPKLTVMVDMEDD